MQQGHKHFVQRHTQNRRLIGRFARVGAMVNRVLAHGDALNRKHREGLLLVVVACVVAIRAFERGLVRVQHPFQHNLCVGRHSQIIADAFGQHSASVAQQTRKLVFTQGIGHRRDRAQNRRGITTQHHTNRKGCVRMRRAMVAKIQRAATVREPAHDEFIASQNLLAINPQILP